MKIYLLDNKQAMVDAWRKYFDPLNDSRIEICCMNFSDFMNTHKDIEAIVSPANSYGLMDGGYDKAIVDYFGKGFDYSVQDCILEKYLGEQPIGTSMSMLITTHLVYADDPFETTRCSILIHTPTMRVPEVIRDYRIVYQCMRSTLIQAIDEDVDSVVIPAFGAGCGQVPVEIVAHMMYMAYQQIVKQPKELNWKYALTCARQINAACCRSEVKPNDNC